MSSQEILTVERILENSLIDFSKILMIVRIVLNRPTAVG